MDSVPPSPDLLDRAFALHRSLPVASGYFEYYGFHSLFAELMTSGWQDVEFTKFLSENWLRLFRACLPAHAHV